MSGPASEDHTGAFCTEVCPPGCNAVPSGPRDDRAELAEVAIISAGCVRVAGYGVPFCATHDEDGNPPWDRCRWVAVLDRLLPTVDRIAEARTVARAQQAVEPFRELFSGGPDTACRTTWRREPGWSLPGNTEPLTECVEVPMADLCDAFARADALGG